MSATVLERAKIQAQILVPLVKALQAESCEARANALVRKTLGDLYRGYSEAFAKAKSETDLGNFVAAAFRTCARDDALAYDVIEQTPDSYAIDIKAMPLCRILPESGRARAWIFAGLPAGEEAALIMPGTKAGHDEETD